MKEEIKMNGMFATIPRGSILYITNPNWDGDKLETQYYQRVRLIEELHVEIPHMMYAEKFLEKLTSEQVKKLLEHTGRIR